MQQDNRPGAAAGADIMNADAGFDLRGRMLQRAPVSSVIADVTNHLIFVSTLWA